MRNRGTTSSRSPAFILRRKARKVVKAKAPKRSLFQSRDAKELLHELEIHQVELEMQNQELRAGQAKLEASRAQYADLYDLAPIGYFTFDARGRIVQVNVNGARLLGRERAALLNVPFSSFLVGESHSAFAQHLREVFKSKTRQSCDLTLLKEDGSPLYVQLESAPSAVDHEHPASCRTAVADITVRRRAEDVLRKAHEELELRVLHRTRELSETNQALEAQIRQRQRAEGALKEAHEELEQRVLRRTAELLQSNKALEEEIVQRRRAEEAHLLVLRRLVEAQEAERCRVARELHDQFGQGLAALNLGLKGLAEQLSAQSRLQPRLTQMFDTVGNMLRDVHSLVWKLRPPALDDLGLATALERYTVEWSKLNGIPVSFHNQGLDQRRLPSQIETTLYRIAQEALTNVFKHAQARNVSVVLEFHASQAALIIEDDGRGFPVETILKQTPGAQGHLGLVGMRERAILAGGTFNIESNLRSGTTVFVRIPIPAAAEPVSELKPYEKNSRSPGRRS